MNMYYAKFALVPNPLVLHKRSHFWPEDVDFCPLGLQTVHLADSHQHVVPKLTMFLNRCKERKKIWLYWEEIVVD